MNGFLIDAQLPPLLAAWMNEQGYDCIHVMDLPNKDLSSDAEIVDIATETNRTLISKDGDFLKIKALKGKPQRLLMITTGNIRNPELIRTFEKNFDVALRLLNTFDVVELGNHFVSGRNLELKG